MAYIVKCFIVTGLKMEMEIGWINISIGVRKILQFQLLKMTNMLLLGKVSIGKKAFKESMEKYYEEMDQKRVKVFR